MDHVLKPVPDWVSVHTSFETRRARQAVCANLCELMEYFGGEVAISKHRKVTATFSDGMDVYRLYGAADGLILVEALRLSGCVLKFVERLQVVKNTFLAEP